MNKITRFKDLEGFDLNDRFVFNKWELLFFIFEQNIMAFCLNKIKLWHAVELRNDVHRLNKQLYLYIKTS